MSEKEWVTLLEVNDRLEAEIIKDALEAQGIPAVFFQEGVVHFGYPVTVGPMSKVDICVSNDRLEDAQAWLASYENGELENIEVKHEEHSDSGDE
jgi:hypothetical protein